MVEVPLRGFDPSPFLAPRHSDDLRAEIERRETELKEDEIESPDGKHEQEFTLSNEELETLTQAEIAAKRQEWEEERKSSKQDKVDALERVKKLCAKVLGEETAQAQEREVYDMFGVVSHYGSSRSGHYIATVLAPDEGVWYEVRLRVCVGEREGWCVLCFVCCSCTRA